MGKEKETVHWLQYCYRKVLLNLTKFNIWKIIAYVQGLGYGLYHCETTP